jgi:serine/threonine-protein kinase
VQVPDVTNKSFEEAQTLLKSPPLNFKVERQEAIVIDKPDDVVVFQVPSAGSRPIRVGSTITVFVNRKPRLPAQGLPNVIGETFDEAKRILEPLEVTISAIDVDSNATKGSVIMQNPDPGTAIAKGDAITLLVSTGRAPTPELVNLPDVIGKSRKEAEQTLRSIGFEVKVETLTVDEPSVVKEQNPKGGDYVKLPKGTSVTLKVGSNPPVVR